jgi:hypothetical protein
MLDDHDVPSVFGPPPAPREETSPDGRIGWPDVVRYWLGDYVSARNGQVVKRPLNGDLHERCKVEFSGEVSIVPPLDGRPYTAEVRDLVAYQALSRSGQLSTWPHRARVAPVEDNRKVPA